MEEEFLENRNFFFAYDTVFFLKEPVLYIFLKIFGYFCRQASAKIFFSFQFCAIFTAHAKKKLHLFSRTVGFFWCFPKRPIRVVSHFFPVTFSEIWESIYFFSFKSSTLKER